VPAACGGGVRCRPKRLAEVERKMDRH
jgi:hypothetical protein